MLWTNVRNCTSLWMMARFSFAPGTADDALCISSRWTHSISLSLNTNFFFHLYEEDWIYLVAVFVWFLHVLFIYYFFFGIVFDFFYCFCFCLGFVVNFDLTGFTKSIYFRTRFVCTNWASIQSLQCDRFVHLQINLDQRVYVWLQATAIKWELKNSSLQILFLDILLRDLWQYLINGIG